MQFLIRYSEIGLKSFPVRKRFEGILIRNILELFLRENLECSVKKEQGRIFLFCNHKNRAMKILKNVFGIASISIVEECSSELNLLKEFVKKYSEKILKKGQTFAIKTKRIGEHNYSSNDVNIVVGREVLNANKEKGIKVNLSNPDITFFIEIRQNKAYIFSGKINCVGGMPLNSQGKVICLINSENDVLAGFFLMKRGCGIIPIFNKKLTKRKKEKLIEILKFWNPNVEIKEFKGKLHLEKIAKEFNAEGIVLGDKFREIKKIKTELPIFYPLVGLTEKEIKTLKIKVFSKKEFCKFSK